MFRIFQPLVLAGGALLFFSPLQAQESLAGLGAASSIGASLGAAAAGSTLLGARVAGAAGGPRNTMAAQNELIGEAGSAGAVIRQSAALTQNNLAPTPVRISNAPIPQTFGVDSREVVNRLRRTPTVRRVVPGRLPRTDSKRARERRTARLPEAQRKAAVARRYKIAPRGWLAAYLPQDRYKFGKNWSVVSTEDSRFYYAPQVLAARRFNPNRVIGFRTWQEAMLAGYQPDPVSKPAPAAQLARLASQTRGANFFRYVDYVYAGQISPSSFAATYAYSQRVAEAVARYRFAKTYLSPTMDRVFQAAVEGDSRLIPAYIGRRRAATVTTSVATGSSPQIPIMPVPIASVAQSAPDANLETGGDKREDEFNRFRNNAGNLANVPANNP